MNALELSYYIINHENSNNREVTNLRLQKLLYFVQASLLSLNNGSEFQDIIQAWRYGPVVPKSYTEFKKFEYRPIQTSKNITDIANKENIDGMLDYLSRFKTHQLVEITHNQTPWQKAMIRGIGSQITNESIREYFKEAENKAKNE